MREQKEFIDRMENIIKGKRIELYERQSSFSSLQDESRESESFFLKVSWPGKAAATVRATKSTKKEKENTKKEFTENITIFTQS